MGTEIEQAGGRALVLPVDVADAGKIKNAAKNVEKEFGPIDIWVNGAMTFVFSPAEDIQPEEYKPVTDVTYLRRAVGL